jgi:hypothetical protein
MKTCRQYSKLTKLSIGILVLFLFIIFSLKKLLFNHQNKGQVQFKTVSHFNNLLHSTLIIKADFQQNDPDLSESPLSNDSGFLDGCQNKVVYRHPHSVWTLLTDGEKYASSAVKLLRSARANTNKKFDAIVLELASRPLPKATRRRLRRAGWQLCQVDRIGPRDEANTFPRFRDQFTKLQLWRMLEYDSVVYFDSDCFIVGNIDRMLDVHKSFSSEQKIGVTRDIRKGEWQSTFNMGVLVVRPNLSEYKRLLRLKEDPNVRFEVDMSEQGFLNVVYEKKWFEIGFEYNANLAVFAQQRAYWTERESQIRVIHYTMSKPWECEHDYQAVCDLWKKF